MDLEYKRGVSVCTKLKVSYFFVDVQNEKSIKLFVDGESII